MTDRLVALSYRLAWALVRRLPMALAERLFAAGADLAYRRDGRGTRRLRQNLGRIVPSADVDATTRAGLRSYARYWLEAFRLPTLSAQQVRDSFQASGLERLDEALAAGRGVVIALPHMGNWDLAGAWIVQRGVPFTTVAERLKPESVFDAFVAYREGLGMEVLPLTGGVGPPIDTLADRLRAGRLVCLVGDRDLSARGVEVRMCGGRTRMPAGPALLAQRTGAALLPVTVWYDGRRTAAAQIHPPVPVPTAGTRPEQVAAMTQQLADVFGAAIAEHPADWHMLQRYWLDPA